MNSKKNEILNFTKIITIIIIIDAAFQVASIHFGYTRFFLNIELILAIAISGLLSPWIASIITIYAIWQEFSLGLASVLHLFNNDQIFNIGRFALLGNTHFLILLIVFSTSIFLALIWINFSLSKKTNKKFLIYLLTIPIAIQAAVSFRDGNFTHPEILERKKLIAGSTTWMTHRILKKNELILEIDSQDEIDYESIKKQSAIGISKIKENSESKKILLIISESFGYPKDQELLNKLLEPIKKNENIDIISETKVATLGSTVFGEFRELCAKIPKKLQLKKIDIEKLGTCLPEYFKQKHYKTVAFHAAMGGMYERKSWYKEIGFEKSYFREDMIGKIKNSRCYSFPGLCDRDLFPLIQNSLIDSSPVFVYWLTLNTHIPYDRRDISSYKENICINTVTSEVLCNYINLHHQFFEGLSNMASKPELKGLEVIVVGDHPPPFQDQNAQNLFLKSEVPMIHFKIKNH